MCDNVSRKHPRIQQSVHRCSTHIFVYVRTHTGMHTVFALFLRDAGNVSSTNPCRSACLTMHTYTHTHLHTNSQKLLVSVHLGASDPHRAMCRMRPTLPLGDASLTHCLPSKAAELDCCHRSPVLTLSLLSLMCSTET